MKSKTVCPSQITSNRISYVIKFKIVVVQRPEPLNGSHILKAEEEKELLVCAQPGGHLQAITVASSLASKLSGLYY